MEGLPRRRAPILRSCVLSASGTAPSGGGWPQLARLLLLVRRRCGMAPAGPRAAGPGSADRGGALPEGFFPPGLKSGRQLVAKLLEEAQEVKSAPADDLTAELVDVLEVLQAMV